MRRDEGPIKADLVFTPDYYRLWETEEVCRIAEWATVVRAEKESGRGREHANR